MIDIDKVIAKVIASERAQEARHANEFMSIEQRIVSCFKLHMKLRTRPGDDHPKLEWVEDHIMSNMVTGRCLVTVDDHDYCEFTINGPTRVAVMETARSLESCAKSIGFTFL